MVSMAEFVKSCFSDNVGIVWPEDIVIDTVASTEIGYIMPLIRHGIEVAAIYDPNTRKRLQCFWHFKDLVGIALKASVIISKLHALPVDVVIGDLSHKNFLVTPQLGVVLIDSDSMQLRIQDETYYCPVATPDFTAPEVFGLGKQLKNTARAKSADIFGLGVLIHYLVYQGIHPYHCALKNGENRTIEEKISLDLWPFGRNCRLVTPVPQFNRFFSVDLVSRDLWNCFSRTFTDRPQDRPTASDYVVALQNYLDELIPCSSNDRHFYPSYLSFCPWCRARSHGYDFFPKIIKKRNSLIEGFTESIIQYNYVKFKLGVSPDSLKRLEYDRELFSEMITNLRKPETGHRGTGTLTHDRALFLDTIKSLREV